MEDPRILKLKTTEEMLSILLSKGKPFNSFKKGQTIQVWNKMAKNYSYVLQESPGENMEFKPYATPGEMLAAGAFEGKYLNDCLLEFPAEWFLNAIQLDKLRPGPHGDVSVNLFGVDSRKSIGYWIQSGWLPSKNSKIHKKAQHPELSDPKINPDERGWFQWYCRYWMGRRIPQLDTVQIKRWKAFVRHTGQIKANCNPGDLLCRPGQRQGIFQWAHDPFI